MELKNPFYTSAAEPFRTNEGDLAQLYQRLYKTGSAVILLCRKGEATATVDLKVYRIIAGTAMFLFPDSIINITAASPDFQVAYFACTDHMFREASFRFPPPFFHFIKENPCKDFPVPHTHTIEEIIKAMTAIYNDHTHRFRYDVAKNLLQIWLMDLYDKTYRWFTQQDIEGHNRQDGILKKFFALIHSHCPAKREVSFYANALYISTKYLTDICSAATGKTAKKLIDEFTMLEIKVLLQNTELPIQEITDRLNFPDQSYLGRFFKRHEGISPIKYREQFNK